MSNIIDFLLETKYWPPRWYCGQWTDALGYTTIISDLLIFLAYFTIPCILIYFFYRIKGIEVERIFIFFALFIVFCGTTHLIDAIIFYKPIYRFSALIKVCTAIISWLTVAQLAPYIKKLSHWPRLKVINESLAEMLQKERENLEIVNKELTQNKAILESFSYRVAHDLKEPVRGIGSYASMLLDDEKLSESSKEYIKKIYSLSTNSQFFINDLLEYSTLDSKKVEHKLIDMEELIKKILKELPDNLKPTHVKIQSFLPTIEGNPTTMKEALTNLIVNAVKYNDKAEKNLDIDYRDNNNDIIFSIKDNGIGIPTDELNNIFTMFYRGRNTRKKDGTGLGLMIVEKIIKQHGGRIWAESELGKGSIFYFTIPKSQTNNPLVNK